MPRPPILPVPDRKAIFESGLTFADWLGLGVSPDGEQRMKELYGALRLPEDAISSMVAISRPVNVVAIAEAWCGDVVRHTPVLLKLADASDKVGVRFVTREQYPDFFARFLTNGGEAVPKFVFCSEDFVETGNWGPMSSTPRKWIAQGKACNDVGTARKKVGEFYTADDNQEAIREFVDLIQTAAFEWS